MNEDWRGEHLIRQQRDRHAHSGLNMKFGNVNSKKARSIERRAKLAPLLKQGMTETDMAAQLGVSRTTIIKDLMALGLK